jgi:hypothetical protein
VNDVVSEGKICARTHLLAQRRDACDVGDVVQDAWSQGGLGERGDGVHHVRARAQRDFLKSRGLVPLAQVASFPVASGPAGKRGAVSWHRKGGRSVSECVGDVGSPGVDVFGAGEGRKRVETCSGS